MEYEKERQDTKLFVSKRSTNFVSHSFRETHIFSFQLKKKNTNKIQEFHFLDEIYIKTFR